MIREELYNSINIVAQSMDSNEIQEHREKIYDFINNHRLITNTLKKDLDDWGIIVAKRKNQVDKNLDYPGMKERLTSVLSIIHKLEPNIDLI